MLPSSTNTTSYGLPSGSSAARTCSYKGARLSRSSLIGITTERLTIGSILTIITGDRGQGTGDRRNRWWLLPVLWPRFPIPWDASAEIEEYAAQTRQHEGREPKKRECHRRARIHAQGCQQERGGALTHAHAIEADRQQRQQSHRGNQDEVVTAGHGNVQRNADKPD